MTAILSRYLEYKLPEVLRRKFPELYFDNGRLCPQRGDLPEGAQYISLETVQHYGEAAIMSGMAQDVPFTEVTVGRETYNIVYIFNGAYYTDPELKSANFASRNGQMVTNFGDERLIAMRRGIDHKSHQLCAFGSVRYDLEGFLNHSEVHVSNSTTYKPYASNATAEGIIDMITSEVNNLWTSTNFVEYPNVLLVAPEMHKKIHMLFRSTYSDSTLYDALMKVNPSIQAIISVRELQSAELEANGVHTAGTNKDRMMLYNLSPENVRRHFNALTVMPPEVDKMRYITCAYKGVSGVKFTYPKTARYIDYPIATTAN